MDQSQQEERQAAAKAFMESLNQLEILQSADGTEACAGSDQPVSSSNPSIADRPLQPSSSQLLSLEETVAIDLNALAAAAADIDQFMQVMQAQSTHE
jgi:hypothetical protein